MSVYTVPQDVEADDRILGPFTFRQFIYLIVVALALGLAYLLSRLFIGLAVIPLPVAVFFGALALPLRRDQPMETYLAALAIYFLKPRKRFWDPDGIETLIEITVPKTPDNVVIKDSSQEEVRRKLSYLADIVDTDSKLTQNATSFSSMVDLFPKEESSSEDHPIEDPLENSETAQRLDQKLETHKVEQKELMTKIVTGEIEPPIQQKEEEVAEKPLDLPNSDTSPVTIEGTSPAFNPYPSTMQQAVIQPLNKQDTLPETPDINTKEQAPPAKKEPSQETPPADIIRLATNDDLSVAAIAREANRIREKQNLEEEVVISLR